MEPIRFAELILMDFRVYSISIQNLKPKLIVKLMDIQIKNSSALLKKNLTVLMGLAFDLFYFMLVLEISFEFLP